MKKSILLFSLILSSIVFCQNTNKHRISLFTGLLQNYADGTVPLNVKSLYPGNGVFNGLLHNSIGVAYKNYSPKGYWWSGSVQYLHEWSYMERLKSERPIANRLHLTTAMNLGKTKILNERFSLDYGIGLLYRYAEEEVLHIDANNFILWEDHILHSTGVNVQCALNYQLGDHVSFFTGVNARAYLFGVEQGETEFLPLSRKVNEGETLNFSLDLGMSFTF
ncbi:hypothetical protein [Lishizhenia sp.]|uniref:hypothetical protein n=1 Tax=Lishizhenia sp. TaxID=2497594 RepID=UPI00299E7CDB|nr:hypothetical protein [Lishizhenia sp.]MDX1445933.1 hypothetical protein [Lishizhenia sp.]